MDDDGDGDDDRRHRRGLRGGTSAGVRGCLRGGRAPDDGDGLVLVVEALATADGSNDALGDHRRGVRGAEEEGARRRLSSPRSVSPRRLVGCSDPRPPPCRAGRADLPPWVSWSGG